MLSQILPIFLESVDSTNRYAAENCKAFESDALTVVHTSYQTGGLGTNNRSWHSKNGENLLASFCFIAQEHIPPHQYTQTISVAITEFLMSFGMIPKIKWPNDILIDGKKIAGILAHTHDEWIIVGVGLNVNMLEFAAIDQPATSIVCEVNFEPPVESVREMLSNHILEWIQTLHIHGFNPILNAYRRYIYALHSPVTCGNLSGTLHGIDKDGYLLISTTNGTIETVQSGSLRLQN